MGGRLRLARTQGAYPIAGGAAAIPGVRWMDVGQVDDARDPIVTPWAAAITRTTPGG